MLLPYLLSLTAHASPFKPMLRADLAASYWDEGAKVAAYPGVQKRLWGPDGSVLFGDTFLRIEGVAVLTPSYARLGPRVTFSPIAVFELSAHYLGSAYFGTFSSIKGFDDPDVVYTDDVVDAAVRGPGLGSVWGVEATLQGKVGPVIAATFGELKGWDVWPAERVQGDYWWEPESELLLSWHDNTWALNAVALYEHVFDEERGRKLYLGAMYSQSTGVDTGDRFARLGPMANIAFSDRWGLLILTQAYLDDRIYTEPLPPYIGLRLRHTWKPQG